MSFTIPFIDYGGAGPVLHFAHANAYPPRSYRLFLDALQPHYRVIGLKQRPLWPATDPTALTSWQLFADDLVRFFDQQGLENIIGVGHSLGAVATLLAARQRPSLFRALVLIEPVFLPPHILQMATANPAATDHLPLVVRARRRSQQWASRQVVFDRWRQKPVFQRWSDEALWDYVNHGTKDKNGQVVLAYPREWEAQVYATPPTTVWEDVTYITHPTLAIRAAESDTIFPEPWQLWQERQPAATFVQIPAAGHMVPMERPHFLAGIIHDWLSTIIP